MSLTSQRALILVAAALAALPGVLAYLGIYRGWAPLPRRKLEGLRGDLGRSWPITTAWFGGGLATQFLVYTTRTGPGAYDAIAFLGLGMMAIAVWTLYHVPWWLHPRWYRNDVIADEASADR